MLALRAGKDTIAGLTSNAMSEARNRNRSPRRWLIFLFMAALLIAGVIAAALPFLLRRPSPITSPPSRSLPSDPRIAYDGPFGNIHPSVAYIGDDRRCVPCHADLCASFSRHPMGRSLAPIAAVTEDALFDKAHHDPFQREGFRFLVEGRGAQVWHKVSRDDAAGHSLASVSFPVHFVIGSGTRGRSYLSNREGYLFQTPISWFAQKQIWDVSPGFSESSFSGRPVAGQCVFCHANRANFHEGSSNRFDAPIFSGHAIGCERCHGPAERHLETLRPFDIVNPKRLATPALRNAVCEQCHLKGETRVVVRGRTLNEFRPGLLFSDFCTVFVTAAESGDERKAVSHVEQMHASRCYQDSADEKKLGCVSCHDPHVFVGPAARVAHYRRRCLNCHESHPCGLSTVVRRRQQADDSCIACHMPRFGTADIAHTAVTDHRILRRPKVGPADKVSLLPSSLVSFHPPGDGGSGSRRDLGIAFANLMMKEEADPLSFAAAAVQVLEGALVEDPGDVSAWRAKGSALMRQGRAAEALASFESALSRMPQHEICLADAAQAARVLGRLPESRAYWLRAIEANPWQPWYRGQLTRLLIQLQAWDEAKVQCEAWKRMEPWSSEAATLWITYLLHKGDRAAARAEFARLESLRPPELERLKTWFNQQLR